MLSDNEVQVKNYFFSILNNYAILEDGEVIFWDTCNNVSRKISLSSENILFPEMKYKIKKIVCHESIAHAITEEGVLISWGEDKKQYGTLGLGYNYSCKKPTINPNLSNKKIIDICMTDTHCCCIDSKY